MKHARLLALLATVLDGIANAFVTSCPTRLARYLGVLPHTVRLPPGGEGGSVSVPGEPVRLILDPQDVYSVDLPLPRGVGVDPWAQAQLQAHRYMPLKPTLLMWDLVVFRRAGQRVARISMVRRSVLDAARRISPQILEITTEGSELQPQFLRLEPQRLRCRGLRILALLVVSVLAVPIPLLLLTWTLDQQTTHMERKLKALAGDVKAVGVLRERVEVLDYILNHSGSLLVQASPGRILDEVARNLPDDSWLQELSLSPGHLLLQGQSANTEDVLSRFRNDPLFTNVHLSTPAGGNAVGAFTLTFSVAVTGGQAEAPPGQGSNSPVDILPNKGSP